MQIKINLRIFIMLIVFYFTRQIQIYAVLMLFTLLHECGHLIVGIFLKFKLQTITINPLGLCINFKVHIQDYNKKICRGNLITVKKLIIALAGPITNFLLVGVFLMKPNFLGINQQVGIYSNLLIGLFNLIPIYPLDGGRILKKLLILKMGVSKSYKVINSVANITMIGLTMISSIAIMYYKNIAILFIIAFLWYLVINENKKYRLIYSKI